MDKLNNSFMYFAYGSNLLKKRIHLNNPSAEFVGIGRLDGHQLDFMKFSNHWRGASATIVPTANCPGAANRHIWGAVWQLHNSDMPSLDRQEGVHTNWYFPKTVTVVSPLGDAMECRTYQQTINPPLMCGEWQIPPERLPSLTYMECILQGAVECQLPEEYIASLKKIPHNGQKAPEMVEKLNK